MFVLYFRCFITDVSLLFLYPCPLLSAVLLTAALLSSLLHVLYLKYFSTGFPIEIRVCVSFMSSMVGLHPDRILRGEADSRAELTTTIKGLDLSHTHAALLSLFTSLSPSTRNTFSHLQVSSVTLFNLSLSFYYSMNTHGHVKYHLHLKLVVLYDERNQVLRYKFNEVGKMLNMNIENTGMFLRTQEKWT